MTAYLDFSFLPDMESSTTQATYHLDHQGLYKKLKKPKQNVFISFLKLCTHFG